MLAATSITSNTTQIILASRKPVVVPSFRPTVAIMFRAVLFALTTTAGPAAYAAETYYFLAVEGSDHDFQAVVGEPGSDSVLHVSRGDHIGLMTVDSVLWSGAMTLLLPNSMPNTSSKPIYWSVGDKLEAGTTSITKTCAVRTKGNEIHVEKDLRQCALAGGGLYSLLMAASSTAVYGTANGEFIGWRVDDIDRGSFFDIAGINDGDIVTKINGKDLDSVIGTLALLYRLKDSPSFSYDVIRNDGLRRMLVTIE